MYSTGTKAVAHGAVTNGSCTRVPPPPSRVYNIEWAFVYFKNKTQRWGQRGRFKQIPAKYIVWVGLLFY